MNYTSRIRGRSVFFAFLFLGTVTIVVPRTPPRIQFHVQLALLSCFFVINTLFFSAQ